MRRNSLSGAVSGSQYEVTGRGDRLAQFEESEPNEGADRDTLVLRLDIGNLSLAPS